MIQLTDHGMYLVNGVPRKLRHGPGGSPPAGPWPGRSCRLTTCPRTPCSCSIRFDAMVSHDITYVGIIQQARLHEGSSPFPTP